MTDWIKTRVRLRDPLDRCTQARARQVLDLVGTWVNSHYRLEPHDVRDLDIQVTVTMRDKG